MIIKDQDQLLLLLKHYMLDNNIHQTDISNNIGKHKTTINGQLSGRSQLTLKNIIALLDGCDACLDVNIVPKQNHEV